MFVRVRHSLEWYIVLNISARDHDEALRCFRIVFLPIHLPHCSLINRRTPTCRTVSGHVLVRDRQAEHALPFWCLYLWQTDSLLRNKAIIGWLRRWIFIRWQQLHGFQAMV